MAIEDEQICGTSIEGEQLIYHVNLNQAELGLMTQLLLEKVLENCQKGRKDTHYEMIITGERAAVSELFVKFTNLRMVGLEAAGAKTTRV